MTTIASDQLHAFERAGLGKAPFRLIAVEHRVGPIRYPNGVEIGAPGQPMGACKFCGQGIADCYVIRSADGKVFDVGCDCVRKTGDAGLKKSLNREIRVAKASRDSERIEHAQKALASEGVRAKLAAQPAPSNSPSPSALEWAEWMLSHAGTAGKLRVCRVIENAIAAERAQ